MGHGSVLVVDDSRESRLILQSLLKKAGYEVRTADSAPAAVAAYTERRPDVCVVDLVMPGMDGLTLLNELRTSDPTAQVVVVTAHGSISGAVDAMRAGAIDFLTKPVDPDVLLTRLDKALAMDALMVENRSLRAAVADKYDFSRLVAKSPQMRRVLALAEEAAKRDVTVLITGESGSGKEVLARAIHYNSTRRGGPFVALNCAAIAENLVESELFGHERGAFTGADRRKEGLIEQAGRGTLLLDEIGDMPIAAQAKLLRVIDNREMIRVGATQPIPVEARLIAATNADLRILVRERRFREDLFYRLNVFAIEIPPLRERKEDIAPLAMHFLAQLTRETGKELPGFADDAIEYMMTAPWRGNVRELANAIERAVIISRGQLIRAADFPPDPGLSDGPPPASAPQNDQFATAEDVERTVQDIERAALMQALRRSRNNLSEAARILGIGRGALRYRLEKFGISPRDV